MRFSRQWLNEWIPLDHAPDQLADTLTSLGLEVSSITPAAADFKGVVVGHIISAKPHPDADRLQICDVDVGCQENLTIVCAGANARDNLKVAVAVIGSVLPGNFKIKKAKLRGQVSMGMLCSASELGLSDTSEGILELPEDAPIGTLLIDYLQLTDQCIEIELTPNRGDCLSLLGVARELSAKHQVPIQYPDLSPINPEHDLKKTIHIESKTGCGRYQGCVISNINPAAVTPIWLKERLRRSNLRSIHPVVDVMNYVMLALGQPMHAFDLNKIQGDIYVREAHPGETITLLDDQTIELTKNDLIISDDQMPLALAGIMGGHDSAVSQTTTNIFLESAYFTASGLALSARKHKLQTDSSYRFERGVDPNLPQKALCFAVQLLNLIVGGKVGVVTDAAIDSVLPKPIAIDLSLDRVGKQLGFELNRETATGYLRQLGCSVEQINQRYRVVPPSHRFDLKNQMDLIEEIARLYGYEAIPSHMPSLPLVVNPSKQPVIPTMRFMQLLSDRGYNEAITYSFISPKLHQLFCAEQKALSLLNPISSDMQVMRASLWPGLVQTILYNQRHQQSRVRLFETGLCFLHEKDRLIQRRFLSGAIVGSAYGETWRSDRKGADFFDLKGDVEALLALNHLNNIRFVPANHPALHPGQAAELYQGDRWLGVMGKLHPKVGQALKCESDVFLFELSLPILEVTAPVTAESVSKFSAVRRDIALLVDNSISFAEIYSKVLENSGDLLKNVYVFDEYIGQGVPGGQKSIALALVLQHDDRTLVDEEVNQCVDTVVDALTCAFNVSLRK